jgi:small conductance mechanosensitive channel
MERDRIEAQLRDAERAGVADAEIATLLRQQQIVEQRINGLVASLRVSADLLERRNINASEYRQALVVSAREVTGDVLDPEVAFGLLADWIAGVWGWVRVSGTTILVQLLIVILLIVLFRVGFRIGWWSLQKVGRVQLPGLLSDLVGRMLRPVANIVGLVVGLWFLGVDPTALVAGLGVAGIIVGLALQDSMSNLAAGIFILLYRPYDREDIVTAGGIIGTVKEMGLANTTIVTFDNRRMYVPNRKIWSDVIENRSAEHARRVEFAVSIAYEEDIDRSYKAIYDLLEENERVLEAPAPYVFASKLADSGIDVTIYAWVRTEDWWPLTTELPRLVRQRFAHEGIGIPYPHVEIVGGQP